MMKFIASVYSMKGNKSKFLLLIVMRYNMSEIFIMMKHYSRNYLFPREIFFFILYMFHAFITQPMNYSQPTDSPFSKRSGYGYTHTKTSQCVIEYEMWSCYHWDNTSIVIFETSYHIRLFLKSWSLRSDISYQKFQNIGISDDLLRRFVIKHLQHVWGHHIAFEDDYIFLRDLEEISPL